MAAGQGKMWQKILVVCDRFNRSIELQWYQLNDDALEIQVIFIHSTHFLVNLSNQIYIKSAISTENG